MNDARRTRATHDSRRPRGPRYEMSGHTRVVEERHGFPGALRAWGSGGGHVGPPHVDRCHARRCAVALALIVAAGCAPTTEIEFERAPGRGEPLQGRIWDVAAGAFVDPQTLVQRLAPSPHVLPGERPANPQHHTRPRQPLPEL